MTKAQIMLGLEREYAHALTYISGQSTSEYDYHERCLAQDETFGAVAALLERAPQWRINEISSA